jgi:predicted nucleic acid-binding protein
VIYLLDVSVLLAAGYKDHKLHRRANRWLVDLEGSDPTARLVSCTITELGFVRIASGPAGHAKSVAAAQADLMQLKDKWQVTFLNDGFEASRLPEWVTKSKQVTDGYLLQLATLHHGFFATLDEGIPGALLIPKDADDNLYVREPFVPYGVAA